MSAATFKYDFTDPGNGPEYGRSFRMSQNSLVRAFSRTPPPRAADLLDVFGAVYAADRRSKRCFKGVATGQRRIYIRMPVREPELWTLPELATCLRELLSWVSEDVWDIEFSRRNSFLEQDSNQAFSDGRAPRIPGNGLVIQRRTGLPGGSGAACPELTWWVPHPGFRAHAQPSGMPTGRPSEADQVRMGTGITLG